MTGDPKDDLRRYLQTGRDALLWKLEGLGEYDARRPLTPTGTNLLGLVKHLSYVELGYFGATFGRPGPFPSIWEDPAAQDQDDMWVRAEESRAEVVGRYRQAQAHSDETIAALPLDAVGRVPHWPAERAEVTLHFVLVHVATETHRHAGHADIVRELVDGFAGLRVDNDNLPPGTDWAGYRAMVEDAARRA